MEKTDSTKNFSKRKPTKGDTRTSYEMINVFHLNKICVNVLDYKHFQSNKEKKKVKYFNM